MFMQFAGEGSDASLASETSQTQESMWRMGKVTWMHLKYAKQGTVKGRKDELAAIEDACDYSRLLSEAKQQNSALCQQRSG